MIRAEEMGICPQRSIDSGKDVLELASAIKWELANYPGCLTTLTIDKSS